jgi:hypothetical protein
MSNELAINKNSDEYQALVGECQAIITEGVWSFRVERILTYGRLGERISEDEIYKRYGEENGIFLNDISKDIGIAYSDICRAVQFWVKFKINSVDSENWSKFKEGKNISWSKVKSYYLPEEPQKECEHDIEEIKAWQCRLCKKRFYIKPDERNEEQRTI